LHDPVIILGAPRSGTTLLARIMGKSDEVFLITEVSRHLKQRNCPEDRSGLSDAELWRGHFTFSAWRADKPRPVCERPLFDLSKLASLRRRYLDMAGPKRLVIKNPFGLARVDMLKTMFPKALFVFALRAPWPTIRSATIKGNGAYIVPTEFVNSLPNDHVFRAAATWAEAIDVLTRERDAYWHVVRYEELVARPHAVITELYRRAGLTSDPTTVGATALPEARVKDFSLIKYQMMRHPYRAQILGLLEERAKAFSYSADPSELRGNVVRYAFRTWLTRLHKLRKRMAPATCASSAEVLAPTFQIQRQRDAA
jgi:Sulfotransferase family